MSPQSRAETQVDGTRAPRRSGRLGRGALPCLMTAVVLLGWLAARSASPVQAAPRATPTPTPSSTCLDHFLVRSGDSLTGIANLLGFDWQVLARFNHLQPPYRMYIGQWLCLPAYLTAELAFSTPYPGLAPREVYTAAGGALQIETINHDLQEVFIVQAAVYDSLAVHEWLTLGELHTKGTGAVKVKFLLPNSLRSARLLLVCLKDASTSHVRTCHNVYNSP